MHSIVRGRGRAGRKVALLAVPLALVLGAMPANAGSGALPPAPQPLAERADDGPNAVTLTRVIVPGAEDIDWLASRYDVAHYTKPVPGGIEIHITMTPAERAELIGLGYDVRGSIYDEDDHVADILEGQQRAMAQERTMAAAASDTLTVLRANWFTTTSTTNGSLQRVLQIEVRSSDAASNTQITATWAGRTGSPLSLSRFTDAGQYMYHRITTPLVISSLPEPPSEVTLVSNKGATVTVPVTQWLGQPRPEPSPHYVQDFVTQAEYPMDATKSRDRIRTLAAEFPEIAELVDLPNLTNGYRRHAQAQFGSGNSGFYVDSVAWGHEGGNSLRMALDKPSLGPAPTSISVSGNNITVHLAVNGSGAITATAAQVVAAINNDAAASALVKAQLNGTGSGTVAAAGATSLSDNLKAPASISRDPFQVQAIRIGKVRDGSKTGVLLYSQEHAREWVTPLTAVETAERLLRNYGQDPATTSLVDDLDIFIIPSINPDGTHYSVYDYASQRRNMTKHCTGASGAPAQRNGWGVDLNRQYPAGSAYDGYSGASTTSCTSDTYAGPAILSEPEAKNMVWMADTFTNIKFSMNTHSYGGYFMWAPGSYKTSGRVTLPHLDVATDQFFWKASEHILNAIQDYRGTAIIPGRVGPIVDVLYSAAGNSADYFWYDKGIYGWSFETGADKINPSTGSSSGVGFQPNWAEAHGEMMEFANGWIGILEVAQQYQADQQAPRSKLVVTDRTDTTTSFTFETNEPANIYYTLDGSRPTMASTKLQPAAPREPAEVITIDETFGSAVEVKWFAVDSKGHIENGYDPEGEGTNHRRQIVSVGGGHDWDQTITAELLPGGLVLEAAGTTVAMPATTLTGADQTVSGALNALTVRDARGTGAGWSLTGQVSDFVGALGVILGDNLGWSPSATALLGSLPTLPGDRPAVQAGPGVAGNAVGAGLADSRMLCSSGAGSSAGQFECGAGLSLGIPGSAKAGTYTGVLTLTLV